MHSYVNNFLKYKDLLFELIKKDIKIKYKNSVLGIIWSMLNPLLIMIVLTIVFSAFFKNHIANFPVYVLTGRLMYQFFSESTNFAMDSIVSNGNLIRKVYVPKYFFPISRVCSSFVTTLLAIVPLLLVMLLTNMQFSWINLLAIFPLLYLLLISAGVGLLLSSINLFFRDMKHLYSVVLMVVMYMTPIFYPASIISDKYIALIKLNPLFTIVEMFRDVVMYQQIPSVGSHLLCLGYAVFYCAVGLVVFAKTQDRFIFHL